MFDWVGGLAADIAEGDYLMVVSLVLIASYGGWRLWMYAGTRRGWAPPSSKVNRFFGLVSQIGLTLTLERLYEFSRAHVAVDQVTAVAYSNGYRLLDFEIGHNIFFEQRLQRAFLPHNLLMHGIDAFYAFAHLFVTLGFLIWLYLRRNRSFMFVRNLFFLSTGIALVIYMVYPAAPPRMYLNFGFVDPSQALGFTAAGGAQVTSYTYNPFAAMPSLHMVYALIVGWTLVAVGQRLWLRALGFVYPLLMLATVLISANHWILDGIGAVVVVVAAALALAIAARVPATARWFITGLGTRSTRLSAAGAQYPKS